MSANSFVYHAGCGHSTRIEHGHNLWRPITIESTSPLCAHCYLTEKDKIHERYRANLQKASELGMIAMTEAFKAEAKNNVGGTWTQEKHDILVAGNRVLLMNIEALECRRQEELNKLASNVAVSSTFAQLAQDAVVHTSRL